MTSATPIQPAASDNEGRPESFAQQRRSSLPARHTPSRRRGSILAAGIQHASWNAAQNLNVVEGGDWEWQTLAAVALLTAGRHRPAGLAPRVAARMARSRQGSSRRWTAPSPPPSSIRSMRTWVRIRLSRYI
jgi:hypothetical protein